MFLLGCLIYFIVLSVALSLIAKAKSWDWPVSYSVGISFCIVFVWFFASLVDATGLNARGVPYETTISEYNISAMRDSSGIEGRGGFFFVSINPDLSINYLQKNADGSLTPKSLSSSKDIRIYESDYNPSIKYKTVDYKCNATTIEQMFIGPCQNDSVKYWYEIYVPQGTIVNTF